MDFMRGEELFTPRIDSSSVCQRQRSDTVNGSENRYGSSSIEDLQSDAARVKYKHALKKISIATILTTPTGC